MICIELVSFLKSLSSIYVHQTYSVCHSYDLSQSKCIHSYYFVPHICSSHYDIHFFLILHLTEEIHCHDLYPLWQRFYTGPLYWPVAVPFKKTFRIQFFRCSLKYLLTRMCSYGLMSSGMFIRLVFTTWMTDMIFECPSNLFFSTILLIFFSRRLVIIPHQFV
jgi:hypothetical protein